MTSEAQEFDVGIIGAGPGGYVTAIRGAQLGLRVALIEKDKVGGVCLNCGCIPTKAMLKNAEIVSYFRRSDEFGVSVPKFDLDFEKVIARKNGIVKQLCTGVDFLLEKNGVTVIKGAGSIADQRQIEVKSSEGAAQRLRCSNIIIATGSEPKSLRGVEIDGEIILSSTEMLELDNVPPSLVVIGAGAVGVEFASMFHDFGSKVTLIEALPKVLPLEDEEISDELEKSFKKKGIRVLTSARVEGVGTLNAKKERVAEVAKTSENSRRHGLKTRILANSATFSAEVTVRVGEKEEVISADKLLMSTGRKPLSESLGLENTKVSLDDKGFIKVDGKLKTGEPGVYAIGDVNGNCLLAHVASAEGIVVVENIAGAADRQLDYEAIPHCTYCEPQVASIGLTEKLAKERGYEMKIGKFPFRASGKALSIGAEEGMVKIIADAKYGEILGVHIIGSEATELIAESSLAKTLESTTVEISQTVHAHPTLSEAFMEAAHAVDGHAIHF